MTQLKLIVGLGNPGASSMPKHGITLAFGLWSIWQTPIALT